MLARYTIVRGAPASTLPQGIRQDARKHTRHVLRPTAELVALVIGPKATASSAEEYPRRYRALLEERFIASRRELDQLAAMARFHDVYIGCNCPTKQQPDVQLCHTTLALRFMKERYPDVDVRFPT